MLRPGPRNDAKHDNAKHDNAKHDNANRDDAKRDDVRAPRARVLLVDDERASREALLSALDGRFHVVTAPTGRRAIEIMERAPVDVVCADFDMTGMTGVELLLTLFSRFPHVSGVLLTGHREHLSTAPSSGRGRIYDILLKPVDADRLVSTIARALDRAKLARELQRREAPPR